MTKAVLITGAAARVGKALALGLAQDGWAVAVHYNRSKDKAEALVKTLKTYGVSAVSLQANLAVPDDLNSLVHRASTALKLPLAALIHNASTFSPDSAKAFTRATYEHHMDVNLWAGVKLAQDFAAQYKTHFDNTQSSQGKPQSGAIINMIDQRVLSPRPDYFTYYLAKSALLTATKTLAQSFAPHIRVNAIGPGPSLANSRQSEQEFQAELETTLLGTGSPPDSLLEATRYLLSSHAVTGQMIAVDGGQHLIWPDHNTARSQH